MKFIPHFNMADKNKILDIIPRKGAFAQINIAQLYINMGKNSRGIKKVLLTSILMLSIFKDCKQL